MEEFMSSEVFGVFLMFKVAIACVVTYYFYKFAQRDATAFDTIYRKKFRIVYVVLFGGGASSNVAANTINRFSYLNMEIGKSVCTREEQNIVAAVKNSLTCTNKYLSVSGKDAPTADEIKMMIKYNSAAQERCVTLKDYDRKKADVLDKIQDL